MYTHNTGFEAMIPSNGENSPYEIREQIFDKEDLHNLSDIIFTAPQTSRKVPTKQDIN